jgi:hypothetical protein
LSPTMRQSHVAGERMSVDYAGATLEVIEPSTGRDDDGAAVHRRAWGVEPHLYRGHVDAGPWPIGSARTRAASRPWMAIVVSDNLLSAITKGCFYKPAVHRTYAEMAILRMGNLGPGIAPLPVEKERRHADSRITQQRPSPPSTGWSRSPGMGGRNQSEQLVAITPCAQSRATIE